MAYPAILIVIKIVASLMFILIIIGVRFITITFKPTPTNTIKKFAKVFRFFLGYVDYGRNEGRQCTGSPRGVYSAGAVVNSLANEGGSTVLKAQWSAMPAVTLITPTRDGYKFLGWYTSASGGTKVGDGGASYTPSGSITLYAHWQLNETTDIYLGTSILDVYVGSSKYDVYQGSTKIYG